MTVILETPAFTMSGFRVLRQFAPRVLFNNKRNKVNITSSRCVTNGSTYHSKNTQKGTASDTTEDHFDDTYTSSQPEDTPESGTSQLYANHIPTTCIQKAILTAGSAALSLATPWRDDMVAVMGEVTGREAIRYMKREMMKDPVGRQILEEKPRINTKTVDFDYLRSLPDGTFGKEYANFLESQRISPDARLPVQFVDDPDLAYVMQRYREVHDMFHVLLGMPTHMLGEVVVKWVEGLQLRLPLGLLGGLFGAIRLRPKQRALYRQEHLWWALRVGRNAHFLMNIYYEHHWEQDIQDMRTEFNIEEPPDSTPPKKW